MLQQESDPKIIKRELISSDKDGTLEKVWEKPYDRTNPDGSVERVEPWEVRATGRKCQELKGIFKDSAPQMLHEQAMLNQTVGMEKVTLADGRVDEVRASDVDKVRKIVPGSCRSRIRPGIMMSQMPWHKPCGHSKHQACHCEEERQVG